MEKNQTIPGKVAQPGEIQKQFLDLKFGMFIHFGINTFYDTEISHGDLPLFNFDPPEVDTDQWCQTAWNAGMNYILFTAKNIDGFCNWPSQYSNYTISQTPYKQDILDKLVNSAVKLGLKIGFSYSLYDYYMSDNDTSPEFLRDLIINQIHELLTRYGPLVELWFDAFWMKQTYGWKGQEGYAASKKDFQRSWRMDGAFRWQWDYIYRSIKEIQPDCLVLLNSTRVFRGLPLLPVDARNAEKGENLEEDQSLWAWLGRQVYLPLQIETTLSQKGKGKFLDGNWYYHRNDNSVAKKWQVNSWRRNAEKIGANLVLNAGPGPNGKLREEDQKLLSKIRDWNK